MPTTARNHFRISTTLFLPAHAKKASSRLLPTTSSHHFRMSTTLNPLCLIRQTLPRATSPALGATPLQLPAAVVVLVALATPLAMVAVTMVPVVMTMVLVV